MKHKGLIVAARLLSAVFRPYYIPIVGFVALFTFTYLSLLPLLYKLTVVAMVYVFTILLPRLCIYVYRKLNGWAPVQLRLREEPCHTLYIVHPVLRGLSSFDVPYAHAALYVRYFSVGFADTDGMRHCECVVENQHAFGRGRWCDRCVSGLFGTVHVQSCLVAVCYGTDIWSCGDSTYVAPSAQSGASGGRYPRGSGSRFCRYNFIIENEFN